MFVKLILFIVVLLILSCLLRLREYFDSNVNVPQQQPKLQVQQQPQPQPQPRPKVVAPTLPMPSTSFVSQPSSSQRLAPVAVSDWTTSYAAGYNDAQVQKEIAIQGALNSAKSAYTDYATGYGDANVQNDINAQYSLIQDGPDFPGRPPVYVMNPTVPMNYFIETPEYQNIVIPVVQQQQTCYSC